MASQGANLSYTKFLFIIPAKEDEAFVARLRAAGSVVARSFFNDFDAEGSREGQQRETIQFLVAEGMPQAISGIPAARYVVQVSGKYRPRLNEVEQELRRRLADSAEVLSLEGADRAPRYTSAEMFDFAYRPAIARRSGRATPNALILPMSKTSKWWEKPTLERHAYFYPHVDPGSGSSIHGHAVVAQDGISTI